MATIISASRAATAATRPQPVVSASPYIRRGGACRRSSLCRGRSRPPIAFRQYVRASRSATARRERFARRENQGCRVRAHRGGPPVPCTGGPPRGIGTSATSFVRPLPNRLWCLSINCAPRPGRRGAAFFRILVVDFNSPSSVRASCCDNTRPHCGVFVAVGYCGVGDEKTLPATTDRPRQHAYKTLKRDRPCSPPAVAVRKATFKGWPIDSAAEKNFGHGGIVGGWRNLAFRLIPVGNQLGNSAYRHATRITLLFQPIRQDEPAARVGRRGADGENQRFFCARRTSATLHDFSRFNGSTRESPGRVRQLMSLHTLYHSDLDRQVRQK